MRKFLFVKVLFVCLGNICRSPLGEAIFREKIRKLNIEHTYQTDSCGTSNYNIGDDPDPRTVLSAHKNGIPISHQARQLSRADLKTFDLILAMDRNNLSSILELCDETDRSKVKLLRSYDPFGAGDVPDPYYGAEKDFDYVFEVLNRSIDSLITTLMK